MNTIIKRAVELLEQGWTQKTMARDKAGVPTDFAGPKAVCWCLEGAIFRAAHEQAKVDEVWELKANRVLKRYRRSLNATALYVWNDQPSRTKEEVLAVLRSL